MGDGLTRAVADVGSSLQTLSPVIRGRCRNGLPSDRHKTAWRSGPRSCQPGFFVGLGFRRRFKSSRPDCFSMGPSASASIACEQAPRDYMRRLVRPRRKAASVGGGTQKGDAIQIGNPLRGQRLISDVGSCAARPYRECRKRTIRKPPSPPSREKAVYPPRQ